MSPGRVYSLDGLLVDCGCLANGFCDLEYQWAQLWNGSTKLLVREALEENSVPVIPTDGTILILEEEFHLAVMLLMMNCWKSTCGSVVASTSNP